MDTVFVRRARAALLVRRMRGRDEEHAVEVKAIGGLRATATCASEWDPRSAENSESHRTYVRSIFTELMRTSLFGRSCELRGSSEIFRTTS